MAIKPTSKADWTEGVLGPTYRVEPGAPKKLTGFVYEEKPPFEWVNWLFWNISRWVWWLSDIFAGYVEVGAGSDVDYADINAAIADGKTKIILVSDIYVGTQQTFSVSNGILKTNGFKIICNSIPIAGSVLDISGNNNIVDSDIESTAVGVYTNMITISGHRNRVEGFMNNNGAATISNGFRITGNDNRVNGTVDNVGGGSITNAVSDTGSNNDYRIVDSL